MVEKMRSIRGCPDYEWEQAVAAAARVKPRKQLVGEWIADAIRAKLAAEREPFGEVEAAPPVPPAMWLQHRPLDLPDAVELALKLADQRTGAAKGRIQRDRLRVLNAVFDAGLALSNDPSSRPVPALSNDPSSDA